MWWDDGDVDGAVVRIDPTGWEIRERPECWFIRPPNLTPLPLPERGGSLDELWSVVNINPEDRRLVTSWLLAAMMPAPKTAAGMLYLHGPAGAGKSTAMSILSEALGSDANSQTQSNGNQSDQDRAAIVSDGWVFGLDNLSIIKPKESDWLCTVITGYTEKLRTLYTTRDVTRLWIRRPVISTAIDLPTLAEDLIRRMIPVAVEPLASPIPEGRLERRWKAAQPRVFGGLLDLLVRVLALGEPPEGTQLSMLAAWGRMAWALDQLAADGADTVALCVDRRQRLAGNQIEADPFWVAVEVRLGGKPWQGSLSALLDMVDTFGHNARRHRTWPTLRSLPGRLERRKAGLQAAGWHLECREADPASHRAAQWIIIPPVREGAPAHMAGCGCDRCTPVAPGDDF